jgi:hypothetical protein
MQSLATRIALETKELLKQKNNRLLPASPKPPTLYSTLIGEANTITPERKPGRLKKSEPYGKNYPVVNVYTKSFMYLPSQQEALKIQDNMAEEVHRIRSWLVDHFWSRAFKAHKQYFSDYNSVFEYIEKVEAVLQKSKFSDLEKVDSRAWCELLNFKHKFWVWAVRWQWEFEFAESVSKGTPIGGHNVLLRINENRRKKGEEKIGLTEWKHRLKDWVYSRSEFWLTEDVLIWDREMSTLLQPVLKSLRSEDWRESQRRRA